MDILKLSDHELLDMAKKSNTSADLTALVDEPDVPKKVRLEIAKRKDAAATRAKFALTDKMYTEEDILWMLIDDSNSDVSARAFTALCDRMTMTSAGIKDREVRDDFIEYVIDVGEKTKMDDYHLSKRLMQQCLKFSKHPEVVKALKKLMATAGMIRLNESDKSQLQKLSEAELLALAKTSDDLDELDAIASLKKLPRKVALEISRRKDPIANAAKITIASSKDTDDDILVGLLDDLPGIEKAAWANIESRIEKRRFKDKDAYYDVADLAISQWKTGGSSWLLSFKALAQIFKDFEDFREDIVAIPGALKDREIKALASKFLNESDECNLLEASYIQLAQQTSSQSQLQKLAESQFESVREIANKRLI